MEDDYESVLWVGKEAYVYKIPPRQSTSGYKAAEWGNVDECFLWKGRLRIIEKGSGVPSKCTIRLEDSNSGDVFAACPYDMSGKSVEAVLDSSRYFVLKVQDQASGKHAFLGMGFPERTDAFDFNVALQDWTKRQRAPLPEPVSQAGPSKPAAPSQDFSLKEGQTFSIKIGGPARKTPSSKPATVGGPIPFLPPPPSAKR